jgi:hypothetical protein
MSSFSATVQVGIAAGQSEVFQHIVPIDLTSIFTGYGPLPAVTGTRNQTGAWDAAGQTRTVILSDGSSANELLTQYDYPRYFSYTVSGFTGVLRFLTTSANGEWWFEHNSVSDATHVKWRYAFNPCSRLSAPILWFVAHVLWRGYMRQALMLMKSQLETVTKNRPM